MSRLDFAAVRTEAEAAALLFCVVSDEVDDGASFDDALSIVATHYEIDAAVVRQAHALVEEAVASVADDREGEPK